MLGLNIEKLAHDEIAKLTAKLKAIDLDHDGISDLEEAKDLIADGVRGLQFVEKKVTPEEIAAALNVLFPGKFTAAEVAAGEAAFDKIVAGFTRLEGVAKKAGVSL